MKLTKALIALSVVALSATVHANAQTVQMVGIGSSALFLELGEAAAKESSIGASCTWTGKNNAFSYALDGRPGVNLKDFGQVWVAWTPGGSNLCQSTSSSTKIYVYLQTDSTVGNRCVLASPACNFILTATTSTGGQNLLSPLADTTMPSGVVSALEPSGGIPFNTAGTDIRPEDAKFATNRALTPCGSPVSGVSGSQYLGLGYATTVGGHVGTAISGDGFGSGPGADTFNVVDFNLTGSDPITGTTVASWTTYDVGAVPVVVFVNPSDQTGLGNLLINNVTRGVLAGFLDGTLGRASDFVQQTYSASGASKIPVITFVREPLSGTYNTMEFAVPNNTQLQSSQDVGLFTSTGGGAGLSPYSPNCSTTTTGAVGQNPLRDTATRSGAGSSERVRTIGTGNMIKNVLAQADSLGYAFWGTSNFAGASTLTGKYLTVDGVDPIQEVYDNGVLPTAANGLLGNVSFSNVKNGSYPIWTKLRMISTGSGIGANTLAAAAQNYVSPTTPDFVPVNQLLVVRSHFAPPYNASSNYNGAFPTVGASNSTPQNGDLQCNLGGANPESGGDVGGLVYTLQADGDYCYDSGSTQGIVGRRQ